MTLACRLPSDLHHRSRPFSWSLLGNLDLLIAVLRAHASLAGEVSHVVLTIQHFTTFGTLIAKT